MTAAEVVLLCRFVRAACPGQPWDEYTAEAWEILLPRDFTLEECRAAVVAIVRRGDRWVDPGVVIAEVRRVRADAAERERTRIALDADAYRADIAARDAAFMRKLAARTGRAQPKAIPPPDYGEGGAS